MKIPPCIFLDFEIDETLRRKGEEVTAVTVSLVVR